MCTNILLNKNLHIPVDFPLSQNITFWEPKTCFVEGVKETGLVMGRPGNGFYASAIAKVQKCDLSCKFLRIG